MVKVIKVANLVNKDDAEFCQGEDCGRPAYAVVFGGLNCNYCGHQINLCRSCLLKLTVEMATVIGPRSLL
jgi:hypothetical protein